MKWEPESMTNEFEYLCLKLWREILIGQMQYNLYVSAELHICQLLRLKSWREILIGQML